MLAGAGILIVVAILATALLGGSDVTAYPPGTPEAAAQTYLQALFDGDYQVAHGLLTPQLQAQCDAHDLLFDRESDMDRAVFDDVRVRGDSAVIDVSLRWMEYSPDPLVELSTNEVDSRLVLERIDTEWRIANADWPLFGCEWR